VFCFFPVSKTALRAGLEAPALQPLLGYVGMINVLRPDTALIRELGRRHHHMRQPVQVCTTTQMMTFTAL
jgi:hypothetical protein